MSDILLVHGSCHGAWCWDHLIPELSARGHAARAIDLPGHGADPTPLEEVTLDAYADAILAALDGPTVLVGHSAGGYAITTAAQKRPDLVSALVYVCAYVPLPGKTLAQMRRMAPSQPLMEAVRLSPGRLSFTIDPDLAPEKFYHDLPPALAAWATARLCPQPVAPQETALPDTARAEALPRHYIRCSQDGAIPPVFQRQMTEGWRGGRIMDLDTSHSPFLSDPARLADAIQDLLTG